MPNFIKVRHNMEVAHRLLNLPGKCQQIHGHSMMVELTIDGNLDQHGILEGLDFSNIKKRFRKYLDTTYDHHLLLNEADPWAQPVGLDMHISEASAGKAVGPIERLPGLQTTPGDPTVENLAKWIGEWAAKEFQLPDVIVYVEETRTNGAGYMHFENGEEWS